MKMNPRVGGLLVIAVPVGIGAFLALYPHPPLPEPKPMVISANVLAYEACDKRNEARTALVEARDLESKNGLRRCNGRHRSDEELRSAWARGH